MPGAYRILLSKRAAAELQDIFEFIAKDSPRNAARMIDRILGAIDGLSDFPHRNVVPRQDPAEQHVIRSLPVQRYLVFFRIIEQHQVVRILRVRHGARRRPKRLD